MLQNAKTNRMGPKKTLTPQLTATNDTAVNGKSMDQTTKTNDSTTRTTTKTSQVQISTNDASPELTKEKKVGIFGSLKKKIMV